MKMTSTLEKVEIRKKLIANDAFHTNHLTFVYGISESAISSIKSHKAESHIYTEAKKNERKTYIAPARISENESMAPALNRLHSCDPHNRLHYIQ